MLVLARRHKFSDLILGVIVGFAAGFFSLKYAPFIMNAFGF
jgi:hypothetical protein